MVGASAQLAAFGTADQYLSAQPQITYFKQIWRRYTQFAMEDIEQSWTGDADFGKKATVSLSRAGDLVTEVWLQVRLPDLQTFNHITGAQRLADRPALFAARHTSQGAAAVEAYTHGGSEAHTLHLWTPASGVTWWDATSDGVLSMYTADTLVSPALVPTTDGGGDPIAMEYDLDTGALVALAAMAPGVAYALCWGGSAAQRADVFVWQPTPGVGQVSFAAAGLDARATYQAAVGGSAGGGMLSATETVLRIKWCNSVGHALVSSVEWELGGSRIDRHTAEHYDMWCELTEPEEKRAGYSDMIGRYDGWDLHDDARSSGAARYVFVPLRFSFNTSPGNALPMLALQFHDCKLNFEFRPFFELVKANLDVSRTNAAELPMQSCKVFARYIFLSQEERMRFAQMPHEYLIEQVQAQVENVAAASGMDGVVNRKIALNLNHPVKEIVFVYQAAANTTRDPVSGNNWFDYDIPGRAGEEIFEEANIQMNGHDRFVKRPAAYWRLAVPWSHHTRCPSKKVHCYSFALHPESWQNPSGAANFSRIDAAHLSLTLNPNLAAGRIRIHGLGYNIMRIANGLGGLVFAS